MNSFEKYADKKTAYKRTIFELMTSLGLKPDGSPDEPETGYTLNFLCSEQDTISIRNTYTSRGARFSGTCNLGIATAFIARALNDDRLKKEVVLLAVSLMKQDLLETKNDVLDQAKRIVTYLESDE